MVTKERNIKLTIAYDGTQYHGFQRQDNGMTVQEMLETRLATIFGHPLKLTGAARTDAGVHAYCQVVNFFTTGKIKLENIPSAARSVLPDDIVVVSAEEVPVDFHARFAAQSKIYRYQIYNNSITDPFLRQYAWHIAKKLDDSAMHRAVQNIVGEHDFSAFRAAGGAQISPVRTMLSAGVSRKDNVITCEFWGTGFLYHMVRNLVGTLVDVGLGKTSVAGFGEILMSEDRKTAGITAPPQGLFLWKIFY